MAFIRKRRPWTSQPQEAVELDRGNDLTNGIVFSSRLHGGWRDDVTGTFLVPSGAVTATPTTLGVGAGFSGSSYLSFGGSTPLLDTTTPTTVTLYEETYTTGAYASLIGLSGTGGNRVLFIRGTTPNYYAAVGQAPGSTTVPNFSSLGPQVAGEKIRFVILFPGGMGIKSGIRLFANGVEQTATLTTFSSAVNSSNFIGWDGGDTKFNGVISDVNIIGNLWSDAQIARYFDNPSQIYRPQSIWVPVSAGGGPTPAGLATEADTSLALTARQIAATGTSTETDAAQALVAVQIAVTGRADETETALALTSVQITVAGLASETDAALALDAGAASAVGVALETDTALALDAVQITVTGIATEVDTALALTGLAGTAPGIASETDTAFALAAVQKLVAGAALEVDTALALSAPGGTLDLILKILVNRQELNPTTGTFTLYDDDGTTVLYTTNAWADAAGTAPYSGGALRRIDALF